MSNSIKPPELPSDKKFGLFFFFVFAVVSLYGLYNQFKIFAVVAAVVSLIFLVAALLIPKILAPFNRAWYEFGMLLGKVISPIVLGIMFFVLITPIALITRLFGRDELKLNKSIVKSYWVERLPPGPSSDSFKRQF